MRSVRRTAIVPYHAGEMFDLVNDVEAYEQFLPWCSRSEVLSRNEETVEATLELRHGAISRAFTTRNTLSRGRAIDIGLLGGPFRHLSGGWRFDPLGDDGCRVTLEMEFEFESRAVDLLFGGFFEQTCNSLVDAFTARAEAVYGAR